MDGGYGSYGGGGGGGYGGADGGYGGGYGGGADGGYSGGAAYGGADGGYAGATGGAYGGTGYSQDTPAAGVGASQGSPSRKYDSQSITPLTVKQLLGASSDHPDNAFHVDGRPLHKIRLLGCISEVSAQNTFVELTLDDCTGSLTVKDWAMDPHKAALLREGIYVEVFGSWKNMKSSGLVFVATCINIVKDHNQITHHMLDALYVHLYNTRGPLMSKTAPVATGAATPAASGFSAAPQTAGAGGFSSMSAPMGAARAGAGGMDPLHTAVLDAFKPGAASESGTNLADVVTSLKPRGFTESQIRSAVEFLATDGHLYNTIDDNHYQFTSRTDEWC